jgi:hypothetical protein
MLETFSHTQFLSLSVAEILEILSKYITDSPTERLAEIYHPHELYAGRFWYECSDRSRLERSECFFFVSVCSLSRKYPSSTLYEISTRLIFPATHIDDPITNGYHVLQRDPIAGNDSKNKNNFLSDLHILTITVFTRVICALFFLAWPMKNRGA